MDLKDYKEKYPNKVAKLDKMETKGKIAEIVLDLKNHEGVKMLLSDLEQRIIAINGQLAFKEDLSEEERKKMFTQRECWYWLISVFGNAEQTLRKINTYLEKL
jgi:hypothetical protein